MERFLVECFGLAITGMAIALCFSVFSVFRYYRHIAKNLIVLGCIIGLWFIVAEISDVKYIQGLEKSIRWFDDGVTFLYTMTFLTWATTKRLLYGITFKDIFKADWDDIDEKINDKISSCLYIIGRIFFLPLIFGVYVILGIIDLFFVISAGITYFIWYCFSGGKSLNLHNIFNDDSLFMKPVFVTLEILTCIFGLFASIFENGVFIVSNKN